MIRGGYGTIVKRVTIKGVEVPISPVDLCELYNISHYEKEFIEDIDLNQFQNIKMKEFIKYLT